MALMPVAAAMAAVLDGVEALPEELVALPDAHHRVLARDIASLRTQPPADMSAMDGYAVRAADVASTPSALKVIGEVAAGRPFDGAVGPGQAARIFTGGVVPRGADAVIIQEDTVRDGDTVTVNEAVTRGRNIRGAGIEFARGDLLLRSPRVLSDRDLSLAAAMNHPVLPVFRKPRVALLATGDELIMPGNQPGPGEIVYSNGFALRALARKEGADVIDLGIARDTLDDTVAAIRRARASRPSTRRDGPPGRRTAPARRGRSGACCASRGRCAARPASAPSPRRVRRSGRPWPAPRARRRGSRWSRRTTHAPRAGRVGDPRPRLRGALARRSGERLVHHAG